MIEKQLLTNFNTEFWKDLSDKTINREFNKLKIRSDNEQLFGKCKSKTANEMEWDHFPYPKISGNAFTHSITNLTLENRCIYGDIEFLMTRCGLIAESVFNDLNGKFIIRTIELVENKKSFEIITWDLTE